MLTKEHDIEKLIQQLQQLPELDPPATIVTNVMEKIRPATIPLWRQFLDYLTKPRHITLQPLPIAGAVTLATAIFWLGMVTGMNRLQPISQPGQISAVERVLQDPEASFLAGRGLMTAGLAAEARPLLRQASLSNPANPEYAYWEGLSYWADGMVEQERASYIRGIGSSPDTVPLLLNLGHSFLEQRELNAALLQYNKVLAIAPDKQAALYNRGLIYHMLQDSQNERAAWKTYLQYYRSGKKSFRAVTRLNNLDDFTYRPYQLGSRKIILSQSTLLKMAPSNEFRHEVEILTEGLRNNPMLHIDIVFFQENDALTARKKALLLKSYIIAAIGEEEKKRVRLSWFGEKEAIQTSNGNHELSESLLLFGQLNSNQSKETKI